MLYGLVVSARCSGFYGFALRLGWFMRVLKRGRCKGASASSCRCTIPAFRTFMLLPCAELALVSTPCTWCGCGYKHQSARVTLSAHDSRPFRYLTLPLLELPPTR